MGKSETDYGLDVFKSLTGKLTILGMSPFNDDHIFLIINQSDISEVEYIYHSKDSMARIQSKISKPLTFQKDDTFWRKIQN